LRIYYRLNRSVEKAALSAARNRYHGVVLSANIAMYMRKHMSDAIGRLGKPFFIDPMVYTFFQDRMVMQGEDRMKKSYKMLAECYGPTVQKVFRGKRSPDSFDSELAVEIAGCALDFQRTVLSHGVVAKGPLDAYSDVTPGGTASSPEFLVAPYFHFQTTDDPWYSASKDIALASLTNRKPGEKLYAVICASLSALQDSGALAKIEKDYGNFDGYIMWVPGFNEYKEDAAALGVFIDIVTALKRLGKPVINLYGGYFSLILQKVGLDGVSSGLCSGEAKRFGMRSGRGTKDKRYFVPLVKGVVPESNAKSFLAGGTAHGKSPCECRVCTKALGGRGHANTVDILFTKLSYDDVNVHYIENKFADDKMIASSTKAELLGQLDDLIEICTEMDAEGTHRSVYAHLKVWKDTVEDKFGDV
jgi:hypothetical protein